MTVPVFMCCSVVYGMRLRPAVALGNGAVGRSACHCVCCIARYIIIPSILSGEPTTPNVVSEARVSDLRTRPAPASLCAIVCMSSTDARRRRKIFGVLSTVSAGESLQLDMF